MFAGEPRQDIQDAFEGCREVLAAMGETSSQAKAYHEILTSFSEAVRKFRQRVTMEERRTVQHYMEQVLVIDVAHTENQPYPSPFSGLALPFSLSGNMAHGTESADVQLDMMLDGFQIDWAELDLQVVDDQLTLDLRPFEGLLCSVE